MIKTYLDFSKVNSIRLTPKEDTLFILKCDGYRGTDKKSLTILLEVPHVICRLYCGYTAAHGVRMDLATTVIHKAVATSCHTVIRGVLDVGGISRYQGSVIIEKTAQQAISGLETKVLVIGQGTQNHAEPIMQIEANDVTASHSSTTGRVDEAQLYYLQTRGLAREEAQQLLVDAFLAEPVV